MNKSLFLAMLALVGLQACKVRQASVVDNSDAGLDPITGQPINGGTPDPRRTSGIVTTPTDGGGQTPSGGGGSGMGTGGTGGNAVAPGCVKRAEICNGVDDDCDGVKDNGFDLMTDVVNCGKCGNLCSFPKAMAACAEGVCKLAMCEPETVDTDKNPDNGCECQRTNGGKELCDKADNDCDGKVDNGFEFQTDVNNCGDCNVICVFNGAAASCQAGKCAMGTCQAGRLDLNKDAKDGCEYQCTPDGAEKCDGKDNDCNGMIDDNPSDAGMACGGKVGGIGECSQGKQVCRGGQLICQGAGVPGAEICDGKDNDCDGMVDESDPLLDANCFPLGTPGCNVTTGLCMGPCKIGKWACAVGKLSCQGAVAPTAEICDEIDNDCDGGKDEDFDKQSDPRTCGSCTTACKYDNAVPFCQAGKCARGPCQAGHVDLDGMAANGCEYQCTPSGIELCDGKDNDCNGKIDSADTGLVPSPNFCQQAGECGKGVGGTKPVCIVKPGMTTPNWYCNYPATVETLAGDPNTIAADETTCDGMDNDCDGASDEHVTVPNGNVLGQSCADSMGMGECQRKGTWKCPVDPKGTTARCDTGLAVAKTPENEICDGKDNDCDGLVDESWDNTGASAAKCAGNTDCLGVRDDVVSIGGTWVYRFEASRVDADGTKQGGSEARACSRTNVFPWSVVNYTKSLEACRKAGMRLCSGTEWTNACKDGRGACNSNYYPYDCSTFGGATCNGAEQNLSSAALTGSYASCKTPTGGISDLSGNLAEWTDDLRGMSGGKRLIGVRGGSISTYQPVLTCDSTKLVFAEDYAFVDTGFRCCSSCGAGQADCGAAGCKNLSNDKAHCGACANACPGAQNCNNGRCE